MHLELTLEEAQLLKLITNYKSRVQTQIIQATGSPMKAKEVTGFLWALHQNLDAQGIHATTPSAQLGF